MKFKHFHFATLLVLYFVVLGKIENVAGTNGGSTISKRRGYNNKCHGLGPHRFSCVRVRVMKKNAQGSSPSGGGKSEGSTIILF